MQSKCLVDAEVLSHSRTTIGTSLRARSHQEHVERNISKRATSRKQQIDATNWSNSRQLGAVGFDSCILIAESFDLSPKTQHVSISSDLLTRMVGLVAFNVSLAWTLVDWSVADPGGVQVVRTPALLIRGPF